MNEMGDAAGICCQSCIGVASIGRIGAAARGSCRCRCLDDPVREGWKEVEADEVAVRRLWLRRVGAA